MVSLFFAMVSWFVQTFQLFLGRKFSIQFSLRQFFLKSIGEVFMEKSLKDFVLVIMLVKLTVHIFLRNHVFLIQKIQWPTFVSSFSAVCQVSTPGGFPRRSIFGFSSVVIKTVPPISSWQRTTNDWDTYEVVNPKHYGKPEHH